MNTSLPVSALRTAKNVPELNRTLSISSHEAAALWGEGLEMPRSEGDWYTPSPSRVRQSADGRWVVRRDSGRDPIGKRFGRLFIVETAQVEFERLQSYDIDVISRGITLSPDGDEVFTVSPWLPELTLCDETTYNHSVAPKAGNYLKHALGLVALSDINRRAQYSCRNGSPRPFLHDVDPGLEFIE